MNDSEKTPNSAQGASPNPDEVVERSAFEDDSDDEQDQAKG